MKEIYNVKEVIEVDDVVKANRILDKGKHILLKVFMDTQLCFQKVIVGPNNFEKIQPFDKIIKIYVLGRIE